MSDHSLLHSSTDRPDHPEWLRIPDAVRLFSLGRSTIYILLQEGKIKSANLVRRGNVRGRRLLEANSIRIYLESLAAQESELRSQKRGNK
jgi:hypothetical protein